jgi:hypothetical protein
MNNAQIYWHRRRRHSRPVAQTTTAALADLTAEINVSGKYKGRLVTDLETLTLYEAQGEDADSAWRPIGVFDDSLDIVPA